MKQRATIVPNDVEAIDFHSHLGNILYPRGGDLIARRGVAFPRSRGLHRYYEASLFRDNALTIGLETLFPLWIVKNERARNAAATLENMRHSLVGTGICQVTCLPIAPFVSFDDIMAARKEENRILPFTSPDFTLPPPETARKLLDDVSNGAMGVKIHPLIQNVAADSSAVLSAVQAVQRLKLPMLLHTGASQYYLPEENRENLADHLSLDRLENLISAFPGMPFVMGHAGLMDFEQMALRLKRHANVYVDTSFHSPEHIRALIKAYGAHRVLFASDWPYGLRRPALQSLILALGHDPELLTMVAKTNAQALLFTENSAKQSI